MDVYDRGTRIVAEDDRLRLFEIYIAKATSFFGLAATRDIYSRAIEVLPDKECRTMCLSFAQVEIKLGEIDRARIIYTHASQMCDPRVDASFWKTWSDFEVKYGNEDTFKEMLRIKRSVQAKFNTDVGYMSAQLLAGQPVPVQQSSIPEQDAPRTMADLEALALAEQAAEEESQKPRTMVGFVRATVTEPVAKAPVVSTIETPTANPDEITIEEEEEETIVERVQVPAAVFGSIKLPVEEEDDLGAKERFKRKR